MNMKKMSAIVSAFCMMGAAVPFTGNYIPEQNVITAEAYSASYGNVWFSNTKNGEEKSAVILGKQMYVCYNLKELSGKSYTATIQLYDPNGNVTKIGTTKLSGSGTSTSNSVGFTASTAGEWKIVVTTTGDITDSFTVTCNVQQASPNAHAWFTTGQMTAAPDAFYVGDQIFLCYEITDKNTGELINDMQYNVEVTLYDPDGNVAKTATYDTSHTYSNAAKPDVTYYGSYNFIVKTVQQAGVWTGKVTLTGDLTGELNPSILVLEKETTTASTTTTTAATTTTEKATTTTTTAATTTEKAATTTTTAATEAIAATTAPTEAQTFRPGDADNSGKIDILDVITINKAILGKEKLTDEQLKAIDFNGNGKPEASESLTVMKYIAGLITDFS